MLAPFGEGFFGVTRKREHLVGRLQPAVHPGVGIIQEFVEFRFLLIYLRLLSCKFFFAYFSRSSHVDERVELLHARLVVLLLVGEDCVAIGGLATVLVLQPLHCPLVEVLRWLHSAECILDLLVQFLYLNTLLLAGTFALGAVVVNISVDVAVLISLCLVFGRDHTSALSAADHARVSEAVLFGLWLAASAEKRLHTVVLLTRYHWLMFALVPVARALRPLKPTVVERVVEHAVETAPSQLL